MSKKAEEAYSLRQMTELTGLSEFTLRGWEGRYSAFCPKRSATGRRLYSISDFKRALALKELTDRGVRISEIACDSLEKLQKRLQKRDDFLVHFSPSLEPAVARACSQIIEFMWDLLKKDLLKELKNQKPDRFIFKILLPLIHEVNLRVAARQISIAEEHLLSSIIKDILYQIRFSAEVREKTDVKILFATPEGDFHELGIMFAQTLAALEGCPSLYIGAHTPKREICEAALQFGATHIVLASTVSNSAGAKEEFSLFVHFLDSHLPESVEIWVGGRNAADLSLRLQRTFRCFSTLEDYARALLLLHGHSHDRESVLRRK